jgi:hypothetical protein
MKLPARGREYWTPELGPIPAGAVAVKAEFPAAAGLTEWVDFEVVDGEKVVLVAGPDVDTATWPHPPETVVLPLGRTQPNVLLVGPGSKEIVIRAAGVIDCA